MGPEWADIPCVHGGLRLFGRCCNSGSAALAGVMWLMGSRFPLLLNTARLRALGQCLHIAFWEYCLRCWCTRCKGLAWGVCSTAADTSQPHHKHAEGVPLCDVLRKPCTRAAASSAAHADVQTQLWECVCPASLLNFHRLQNSTTGVFF